MEGHGGSYHDSGPTLMQNFRMPMVSVTSIDNLSCWLEKPTLLLGVTIPDTSESLVLKLCSWQDKTSRHAPTVALETSKMHGVRWRRWWWPLMDNSSRNNCVWCLLHPAPAPLHNVVGTQGQPRFSIPIKTTLIPFPLHSYDRRHHSTPISFHGSKKR